MGRVCAIGVKNSDITLVLDFNSKGLVFAVCAFFIILVRLVPVDQIFEIVFCREGDNPIGSAIEFDGFKLSIFFDPDFDLLAREGAIDLAVEWLSEGL